jgi:hypothetical protein
MDSDGYRSSMGRFFRRGLLLVLSCLLSLSAHGAGESDLEAKVKAAYLYHLTRFVDWPVLPPQEIRICVMGSDAVGRMLGELSNRPVRDRTLKIEVEGASEPGQCQVLFIGRGERRLPEVLKRVRGSSALTVSDAEDFARQGGMVGFYAESGKIKLEINQDNARAAGLRISAKLLELARVVP